ncbi:type I polyketide synthase [Egbenema bharatensis]|uniref:type I polyketide synthase n=1 Tax=Egbenema bharatensis TaxID=3463334 RepID=UPI003A861EAD
MNSDTTEFSYSQDEIAIIGMAGRFPGASNPEQLWQNLRAGIESISFFSDEALTASGIDAATLGNSSYVRAGAVLEEIDLFDADFFGFTPREAEIADPQQRLLIECVWEALEQAGYDSEQYPGQIGLYTGVGFSHYSLNNLYPHRQWLESTVGVEALSRNDKDYLSTIISYKLNLKGPSLTVQTACSTSLVAVHLACQSLLNGESDLAIAGGVSIKVPQKSGYRYQEGGILSPDGHCRAFDANAKGTIFGSGVGVVVLKRLDEALAEGDRILAVIKGSAINNDGALKVGYTAPSVEGQAAVISEALAVADVDPETIHYVEAHGTGTSLGDPIELTALTQAFRRSTSQTGFCAIGSIKTNIGHLDTAAGIAGLIKTVLALQHQQILPSLNFAQPNPQIDFEQSPFYVNTHLRHWESNGTPRRAGVSSFGIGGTNAHVVLEEAPTIAPGSPARPWQLLLLSAKTPTALEAATARLTTHLKQHPEHSLADVAYTLQVGRRAFEHRRLVVCQSLDDAVQSLENSDSPRVLTQVSEDRHRSVVFMFSGQGSQYPQMGQELYEHEPVFRDQIDRCCELLQPHLGFDLRQVLYSDSSGETAATQLQQTAIAQPALFVVEYAVAQLWMSWGIQPEAMIGHSIGEYVAACLAGVFSLEDALTLVAIRGKLMQQLPQGAMLSVPLSETEMQPWLNSQMSLASLNAPGLCVVSGTDSAIQALQSRLLEQGIESRRLKTSHAFHSAMMEPVLAPFAAQVQRIPLNPPQIPVISNLTGTWLSAAEAINPTYWVNHLRQPVRFASGIATLLQESERIFLEVGPGRTLSTLVKQQAKQEWVLTSLRHPQDSVSDETEILTTLGRLWLAGVAIDWASFTEHERRQRVLLPTYPFERQRYWIDPPDGLEQSAPPQQNSLKRKPDLADWFYLPTWKRTLPPKLATSMNAQTFCWLLFIDGDGISLHLANRLEQMGHTVITVSIGEQFTRLSQQAYSLNPQERQDYVKLMQSLQSANQIPEKIIHLWTVTPDSASPVSSPIAEFRHYQKRGFYSLLFLAQAIAQQNLTHPMQLHIVSNHLHEVVGGEPLIPAKATLLGCCKVIPQEYPNLTCRSIDIEVPDADHESDRAETLITELITPTTDLVVAHRGDHRWVQAYEPIQFSAIDQSSPLREAGVYLIAGDLSQGLGTTFCEHLAKMAKAKIALVGKLGLPDRSQWQEWLATQNNQSEMYQYVQILQAMETSGIEILLIEADVANENQMRTAIRQVNERFGEIHGVFYVTPMSNAHSTIAIQQIGYSECEQQFHTKVYGLSVLADLLQDKRLDFCLVQSSLSSVVGGLGLIAYAAANLFTDALTHQQNRKGTIPWLSVNWDACRTTERKAQEEPTAFGSVLAELAMSPGEVWDITQRLLANRITGQLAVSPGDLRVRLNQWIQERSTLTPEQQTTKTTSQYARPRLQSHYVAPRTPVEAAIVDIWQTLLGIEQVGIHDNFFELGGHSLLAVQVTSRLREAFQVELPLKSILFDAPTVAGLAAIIHEQQPKPDEMQEIAALLAEAKHLSSEEIARQLAQESLS